MSKIVKKKSKSGNLVKNSAKKLGEIAEKKKEDFIVNIQNTTAFGILLKWIITNKVSIILFIAILFYAGRSYYMENEYLKERNKTLISEKEEFLNRTKELESKVLELRQKVSYSEELNKKVRERSRNLTSEQKKKEILRLVDRLKDKRGLK